MRKETEPNSGSEETMGSASELEKPDDKIEVVTTGLVNFDSFGPHEFRILRQSLGYTQTEYGTILGVSRSAIARAEGKQGPSDLVISRLKIANLEKRLVIKSS